MVRKFLQNKPDQRDQKLLEKEFSWGSLGNNFISRVSLCIFEIIIQNIKLSPKKSYSTSNCSSFQLGDDSKAKKRSTSLLQKCWLSFLAPFFFYFENFGQSFFSCSLEKFWNLVTSLARIITQLPWSTRLQTFETVSEVQNIIKNTLEANLLMLLFLLINNQDLLHQAYPICLPYYYFRILESQNILFRKSMKRAFIFLMWGLVILHALPNSNDPCANINCSSNFRCQAGRCLKQQKQAQKSLCIKPEFYDKSQARRCTNRDYTCDQTKNLPSCGFDQSGNKKDFANDCVPCLDQSIDYYYRLACSDTPNICSETQECINGKCNDMFDTAADQNRKICNSNGDCKPVLEMCVANKCVKKMELFSQLKKNGQKYQ